MGNSCAKDAGTDGFTAFLNAIIIIVPTLFSILVLATDHTSNNHFISYFLDFSLRFH
jgi:hypothetical protein